MREHYIKILEDAQKRAVHSLGIQVKTQGTYFGGFLDRNGLVHAKFAVYRVTTAIAVYCCRDSEYFRDEKILEMIKNGLSYIKRCQHENGLFDLISCNFDSAPDTAFCVKRFLPVLHYLKKHGETKEENEVFYTICEIVKKGAEGMITGGFHTPNHRWAIASNLMECGIFFENEDMIKKAQEYLREGIDCNQDGEYTEKSAGNYNRINNDAMITLGNLTEDPVYYDCAVRNLNMMLTYFEADGSIFTANSTRQDKGRKVYPRDYYLEYLYLGYEMDNLLFLKAAGWIFQITMLNRQKAPDCLISFMNYPELVGLEWEGVMRLENYSKYYSDSGIFRGGRRGWTYTLMKGQSGFLHLAGEHLGMQMKVCGSFFRHRSFCPEFFEVQENGFLLKQQMEGWYYLPYKEKQSSSNWWEMDPEKREKIFGPLMNIEAQVKETEDGLDVTVRTNGPEQAPFRIEVEVTGAKYLWSDTVAAEAKDGQELLLRKGNAVFSHEEESIEIGPGFGHHFYTRGREGSELHSDHAFTLYFTDYTNFEHTIRVRVKKQGMMIVENGDETVKE